ncbi:hypothetical protein IAU59_007241 [Kwoniella sp. CBS 9459]
MEPLNDTIKIVIIVLSPVIFFAILFLCAYLYRRYRTPRRDSQVPEIPKSKTESSNLSSPTVWNHNMSPYTSRTSTVPCNACRQSHIASRSTLSAEDSGKIHMIPDSEFGTAPIFKKESTHKSTRTSSFVSAFTDKSQSQSQSQNQSPDLLVLAQPHFAEKACSIRRVSINPFLPDEITRVNSISSTLTNQPSTSLPQRTSPAQVHGSPSAANSSSDVLPYRGGRRASHASTVQPRLLGGSNTIEANSLKSNVVAVGDRRPSVLSGGLADGPDTERLSVRKISVGGWEDQVVVQAAGVDPSKLPVKKLPSFYAHDHGHQQQHPSACGPSRMSEDSLAFQPPRLILDQGPIGNPVPSPHPFSTASIRRSSFIAEPNTRIEFPVPRIRNLQISIPVPTLTHHKMVRPGSLDLDGPVRRRKRGHHAADSDRGKPSRQVSLALPTNCSTRALKSAPLYSATTGTPFSSDPWLEYGADLEGGDAPDPESKTSSSSDWEGGMFGDWRGFPPKTSETYHTAHGNHSVPEMQIGLAVLPATPQPYPYQPGTPAKALAQLDGTQHTGITVSVNETGGKGIAKDDGLDRSGVDSDDKRSSSRSSNRTSRITYLADVVKEEEQNRLSILCSSSSSVSTSSPDQIKPPAPLPEVHLGMGNTKRQLGDRPPSLSPLRMGHGLGLNFALAPGMDMGMAQGLEPAAEARGPRSLSGRDDDGLPRVL